MVIVSDSLHHDKYAVNVFLSQIFLMKMYDLLNL